MKITRRQLRKMIVETINEDNSGEARGKILNAIEDVYGVSQEEAQQLFLTIPGHIRPKALEIAASRSESAIKSYIRNLQKMRVLPKSL